MLNSKDVEILCNVVNAMTLRIRELERRVAQLDNKQGTAPPWARHADYPRYAVGFHQNGVRYSQPTVTPR